VHHETIFTHFCSKQILGKNCPPSRDPPASLTAIEAAVLELSSGLKQLIKIKGDGLKSKGALKPRGG
jgi:hypothetical protein